MPAARSRSPSRSPTPAIARSRSAVALSFLRDQRRRCKFHRKTHQGHAPRTSPAGTAVRFEPGQSRTVELAHALSRRPRVVHGFQAKVIGQARPDRQGRPVQRGRHAKSTRSALCRHVRPDHGRSGAARRHRPLRRGREGSHDRLRRGSEVRRRQGDPRWHGPEPAQRVPRALSITVITNALIIDHWGIVKADIGLKGGLIVGDRQGRQSRTSSPASTSSSAPAPTAIAGEGRIITAGGIDCAHPLHRPDSRSTMRSTAASTTHDGRRHWPGARHAGHHGDARACGTWDRMLRGGRGRCPMNLGLLRQGQHQQARAGLQASRSEGGVLRPQAARGLGHHAGGDRQLS